jgi:hypothetical protein
MPMTESQVERLRDELAVMRHRLLEQLVERVDGGALALLSSVNGALRAVDDLMREQDEET